MAARVALVACYIVAILAITIALSAPLQAARLTVTNDGPAVVGSPITFSASYPSFYESFVYEFKDKNNDSIRREVVSSVGASVSFVYDKIPEVQDQEMVVTVWQQWLGAKLWRLDSAQSRFQLSNYLVGEFAVDQEKTPEAALSSNIVSTASATQVTFHLHDPSGFFAAFEKSFKWAVNGIEVNGSADVLDFTFSPAAEYTVSCYVMAISQDKKMDRHVNLTSRLVSKEPITKLKLDGKFFIPRNQSLDLKVSCESGTGTFSFCKEIDYLDNCTSPLIVGQKACSFHVGWYFRQAGKHNVSIRVTNDVSSLFERIEISVIDFQIQPSLTFVVIPVACSIMAIVIVVFGIALHVQQRKRFTVEVADFDFSARDDSLIEKTFFERLSESIVSSVKGSCFASRRRRRRRGVAGDDGDEDSAFGEDDGDRSHDQYIRWPLLFKRQEE